ncbi:MAG: 2-oxo acid dehydrogenase subunit E2, partial [Candidatus Omnitrophica bacterium]|nr:2-oxo acid dehydrogenase subunit E2 [Candidatus Omnitrophota bacterium]
MLVDLKVPAVGESITEVEIGEWLKAEGDRVDQDQSLVTIESEKATMELPAPVSGILRKINKAKGQTAVVGEVIGQIEAGEELGAREPEQSPENQKAAAEPGAPALAVGTPAVPPPAFGLEERHETPPPPPAPATAHRTEPAVVPRTTPSPTIGLPGREEEVVPMSRLRKTIARRLVEARNTAALLTTFNEIDMSALMALRREFQPLFQERYRIKLGIMSFFVKASVDALKRVPQVNT